MAVSSTSTTRCSTGSPYVPRRPEEGVLHRVIRQHLETFLTDARARSGGDGLPRFVERELRDFLWCGSLTRGFARFQCEECKHEILVALSCKGRGFCASCCGRRMAEIAAHLTDNVLGGLPVRQWVLSLPHRLRYVLAWDHKLCLAVLAVFIRGLLGFERRRAASRGVRGGLGGAVTSIQRFGSSLNLNVHLHTLAVQGVFVERASGEVDFVPLPAPTGREVATLLASIRRRILRLARRHGIELERSASEVDEHDALADESPVLAGLCGAAVLGRVATGARAGQPVLRIGRDPDAPWVTSSAPCHAHLEGFDLHAGVAVPAGDSARLEHLARYVLRPPVAHDALELTADGRVLLKIRRPWHDGTRAILFDPLDFLSRLASIVPRPRVNLVLYHGILGPHARLRRRALEAARARGPGTPDDSSAAKTPARADDPGNVLTAPALPPGKTTPPQITLESPSSEPAPPEPQSPDSRPNRSTRQDYRWADLLRRTFELDVLACGHCGGRMRLLATITDPGVIRKILAHLGLSTSCPEPMPARPPPEEARFAFAYDAA